MRKAIIIFLLIIGGCSTPADKPAQTHFDTAIQDLSITTQQLESVRREKDFFVKTMEDFEQQKTKYALFLTPGRLGGQMQDFAGWHRDIVQRERGLEAQHAINVFAAHNQVAIRKSLDPNQTTLVSLAP
jgi:hypothetical protein